MHYLVHTKTMTFNDESSLGNDAQTPAGLPALLVRNLRVALGTGGERVQIVSRVDIEVRQGELVALLGESGSGKSVTAQAIMGLLSEAEINAEVLRLGEHNLLGLSDEERRKLRGNDMSLVMQDALSALNPVLTIGNQIADLIRAHRNWPKAQIRERSIELLSLVGIPSPETRVDDYPHQFSGGMRQRILIAMAIALEPKLLIADEPTTALDVTVQAQILELLDTLRAKLGMGVLLITHDLGVVMEVADRLAVMYAGRIVEQGSADQILTSPKHPYTEALLRSMPQGSTSGDELFAIPGSPPSPKLRQSGCPFAPRCHMAREECTLSRPPLVEVGPDQEAACFFSKEVGLAKLSR